MLTVSNSILCPMYLRRGLSTHSLDIPSPDDGVDTNPTVMATHWISDHLDIPIHPTFPLETHPLDIPTILKRDLHQIYPLQKWLGQEHSNTKRHRLIWSASINT